MVAIFAHRLDALRVGNSSKHRRQVKFTTELTDNFLVKVAFFKEQAHLSEQRALKEVIESASHVEAEVVAFDSGLSCRKTFKGFSEKQTRFITKGKQNLCDKTLQVWTAVAHLPQSDDLQFDADLLVHLYSGNKEEIEQSFRLIQACRKSDGKMRYFVTNLMDLRADEIARLYKQRWAIEVLFKFMKQEMNLSHFLCHDENAIAVMLYCTLIASVLMLAYKQSNGIGSFKIAKIRFSKSCI